MNEITKKLAEKAGFSMWGDEHWNPGDVVDRSASYDKELQEFLKLVVNECISLNAKELSIAAYARVSEVYFNHFKI